MTGLAVIIGAIIVSGSANIFLNLYPQLLLGFFTGFLLTGSSMIFNDIADLEIDRYNQPNRPLASGRVLPRNATLFGVATGMVGLAFSFMIGLIPFIIAVTAYVVALLYNFRLKKEGLIGNFMVSYTVMIPILFGGAIIGEFNLKTILFSIIIFLANTGREITKGIVDTVGDRIKGIKTVAVQSGPRIASFYAFFFYSTAILLSFLPYVLGLAGKYYLVLVLVVDIGILYYSMKLLRDPSSTTALKVKTRILYLMLLGLIAFGLAGL